MAGEDGVSYDSEKQGQVAPKVQESQEAVQTSSRASYALSAAQTSSVWGSERGPSRFGHRSSDMFSTISDILAKENDLIGRFETEMRNAMESHTRTDSENADAVHNIRGSMDESAQKGAVAHALARVNNSQEASRRQAASLAVAWRRAPRRAPQQVPRQASHPAGRPRARGTLRFRGSKRTFETSYYDRGRIAPSWFRHRCTTA